MPFAETLIGTRKNYLKKSLKSAGEKSIRKWKKIV